MANITSGVAVPANGAPVWLPLWAACFFLLVILVGHSANKPTPMEKLRTEREQSRINRLSGFKATDDRDVLFAGCYLTSDGRAGRVFSAPDGVFNGSVKVSFGDSDAFVRYRSLSRTSCS